MLKTPADWITAARFALALVLFALLGWAEQTAKPVDATIYLAGFVIFVVAAVSDALDGFVARRTGTSDFGRIADPFVDKVLVVGTLVFLASIPNVKNLFPAWMVVLIVAREFLVTGMRGYVESRGRKFPADNWGKAKMVFQCLASGGGLLLLAFPDAAAAAEPNTAGGLWASALARVPLVTTALMWLSVALTAISGAGYVVRARQLLAGDTPAR
jgi:CDP-diacylglycerol--glycerol-3-phosphate 3-phosphatidyltransferase